MKYYPVYTAKIKRQLKLTKKRGYNMELFKNIVTRLSNDEPLDDRHKDHALHDNWEGFRECHILPDWLLIYKKDDYRLLLYLERSGTHSDLFE